MNDVYEHLVIFRYNVVIGSSTSIMGPQIPEETKETFSQHLNSYNFWSLTGKDTVVLLHIM